MRLQHCKIMQRTFLVLVLVLLIQDHSSSSSSSNSITGFFSFLIAKSSRPGFVELVEGALSVSFLFRVIIRYFR